MVIYGYLWLVRVRIGYSGVRGSGCETRHALLPFDFFNFYFFLKFFQV